MIEFTQIEEAALANFIASPGPLRSGLEKFLTAVVRHHQEMCAAAMATVPRDPEIAADHAAKAQVLGEFWSVLADYIANSVVPSGEPTPGGDEEE